MKHALQLVQLNIGDLQALLERAKAAPLSEEDYTTLKAVVETLEYLTQLLEDRQTTIQKLRQILFGASTEKTRKVLKTEGQNPGATTAEKGGEKNSTSAREKDSQEKAGSDEKRKGHGRNGAAAYSGATKITVDHESLKPGDSCPGCLKGKVYKSKTPGYLVRIVGQAPVAATIYELGKLRCNLCGEVFMARAPEGVGEKKFDETAGSMIAVLKYGSGFPFYRLERLQKDLKTPLPDATQWEIVEAVAGVIKPAFEELIRQAAQGEVLYNDDTGAKILELMRKKPRGDTVGEDSRECEEKEERTGVFTSGIVSTNNGRKIALFFTGNKHAGENLTEVLRRREAQLGPPIQMCDALSRNLAKELEVILANCLTHGRRKFVDVAPLFPEECRTVLETLREVYKNDAIAKEQAMSAEERLSFHQAHSGPLMEGLEKWLTEQFAEQRVEPNSGLGKAITYMKKHFKKMTLFLRVPGAPLDNNICERILKMAILHRKNAMFFKTTNGAYVSDLFMSLIHTCQLCNANPFDYLTELQKHSVELARSPQDWMPWNYRETLQRTV